MKPIRNIWLMYAVALLQGMVFYGPIATLYRQAAGISIFQITLIESISLALCLLFELPWGIIADRIGYKRTMVFCCVLYFISKLVFWKADGFGGFMAERIMLSIVISGLSGVDSSILYLSCQEDRSQKVFGIYNNLQTAGLLMASAVFSLFIKDNYRMAGLLTVISYAAAAILAFFLVEVKSSEKKEAKAREFAGLFKNTVKNRYLLLFLIAVALLNETHQTVTVFLNQLQYIKCGLFNTTIGYIYIIVTLAGMLGVFSEKLTRKMGLRKIAPFLYISAATACLILGLTSSPWLSALSIIMLRISFSLFQPLQTELQNRQVLSDNRATELSINAVIIDGVGITTNLVYGRLAEIDIALPMFSGVFLCLIGFLFFQVWQRGTAGSLIHNNGNKLL
ncbi:MFS transporter [Anaerocolumna jejuensis]|uniref:MFS transporter n=1 Tax=Anaerocolumna jejuensis TaxID=259063 RepID=UPI003F7BA256